MIQRSSSTREWRFAERGFSPRLPRLVCQVGVAPACRRSPLMNASQPAEHLSGNQQRNLHHLDSSTSLKPSACSRRATWQAAKIAQCRPAFRSTAAQAVLKQQGPHNLGGTHAPQEMRLKLTTPGMSGMYSSCHCQSRPFISVCLHFCASVVRTRHIYT